MFTPTVDTAGPTIARPNLDEEARSRLGALPPYKVMVLNATLHTGRISVQSSASPTKARPEVDDETRQRLHALPPYRVVVLDCNCHTFEDVELALCRVIPGMTRAKAHQHAYEIHTTGASVVARAPKERAERYQGRLAADGLRVTIEPD